MKEFPVGKCVEARDQYKQCDQNSGRGPGLAEYRMWKLDTKLVVWVSFVVEIHLDSFLVFSYTSQITLYRSLHACWQSILEFTIKEISYLGSLSIMTEVEY